MELNFKYGKDEFIRGYRQAMKKSKVIKGYDIILYLACIAGAFFMEGIFRWMLLLAGLIGIGGLFYQTYLKPKKIYDTVEMFQEDYHVLIMEEGIEVETKEASGLHKWEDIKKIHSDKEFFYIEEENGAFLFLPKRAFTEQEIQEMDNKIQYKLSAKK